MSKSKIGIFSVLLFGVMMLLIPASLIANAQEYGDRYYESEQYKKVDKESYNEPIIKKDKKKKMKEPPMLLVKKDVLYCDFTVGQGDVPCFEPGIIGSDILGPDSDVYIQQCSNNPPICDTVIEAGFDMIVTDDIEFSGSEDGKKINFHGERYTVTEEPNIGTLVSGPINSQCQEAGFDGGFILEGEFPVLLFCTVFEGECSGIVQNGELKECTVKNYLVASEVF
ncbi:MAG: hypothetical protein ACPKQO_03485 [Nitrososphaeraceae archaeon]